MELEALCLMLVRAPLCIGNTHHNKAQGSIIERWVVVNAARYGGFQVLAQSLLNTSVVQEASSFRMCN